MENNRSQDLRQLAQMLFFQIDEEGGRFTLTRTADVPEPVRHEGLSLDQAEELLNTWKLRGPHGG